MIRILVCFHTLPDLEQLTGQEWTAGCEAGHIDASYLRKRISECDESALELALRYRASCGDLETEMTAVTIGGRSNDAVLSTLAALGFDHTARIEINDDAAASELGSGEAASMLLSWIERSGGYDLIITGQQSGDGNQGKVPVLLASRLGTRCITYAEDFSSDGPDRIRISWQADDGLCTALAKLPLVISVGTVPGTFLRVPTLRQRMAVRGRCRELQLPDELMKTDERVILRSIEAVSETRDAVTYEPADPEEAADIILRYYRQWTDR